jgi:DNA mismatch repair protein MutS
MMNFHSILFELVNNYKINENAEMPAFFVDLNLDQIIDAVISGKKEYHLKPFYYSPTRDTATIQYRQEVMRDLENANLIDHIQAFAQNMIILRRYLGLIKQLEFKLHRQGWFLEAVHIYCEAVTGLALNLSHALLESRGLLAFREFISGYVNSDGFTKLLIDEKKLRAALSTVRYCVIIKNLNVKVRKYEGEIDYSQEVLGTFEKFKQGAVKDYRQKLNPRSGMNHVEAQILYYVSKLYPDVFASLDEFCTQHSGFLDETIQNFDREIQFYIAYLEYIQNIKRIGLKFCYPQVSIIDKETFNNAGFDLALSNKLISENAEVVTNDFYLEGKERIIVVSGPNQGGKTTFARTFGQLHYLASLGCPVPGEKARLFLPDRIFTHFEKEENIKNLRGKLQDDLIRIADILEQATPDSLIIMNEIFTSTSLKDAVFLGKKIAEKIVRLDSLCVCVTFLDELASFSEKTVSMVSTVVPENPALRTFKIVRRPADGLAYAISIVEKYRLTYKSLKERIES